MIPQLIYALWCVFFAYLNYIEIVKLEEKVLHWANGLAHLVTCLYFSLAISVPVGLSMLFIGRVFFDTSLNIFRMGWRNIGYVPRYPVSIVDKIEKYVFKKDGITPKVLYALIIIVLIIIQ